MQRSEVYLLSIWSYSMQINILNDFLQQNILIPSHLIRQRIFSQQNVAIDICYQYRYHLTYILKRGLPCSNKQ